MGAVIVIGVFWLACVPFAYAASFAQCQRQFPSIAADNYAGDRAFAISVSIFGPVTLAASALAFGGFPYGLKWR